MSNGVLFAVMFTMMIGSDVRYVLETVCVCLGVDEKVSWGAFFVLRGWFSGLVCVEGCL